MTRSAARDRVPEAIRRQLQNELVPLVPRIDRQDLYPEDYLRDLGAAGGFGMGIPRQWGGQGFGLARQINVTAAVAMECGAASFLVWCQSVSAWYLLHAPNAAVRQRYLAAVAQGALLSGTGMSNAVKHLSGIEKIHLQARRDGDGYRVDGILPWVSNLGEGHLLIAAAEVAGEGYVMFAAHCGAPGLSLHPCAEFLGMAGTGTVNPRFAGVSVPAADVVAHPHQFANYIARIKPAFILGQVGIGLGIVEGCLATIRKYGAALAHVNAFLDDQEAELANALQDIESRTEALAAEIDGGAVVLSDVLHARARASELTLRAANSAMLHAGARGYLMRSPEQRRLREAVFVSIVTPSLKHLRKEIRDLEEIALRAKLVA